MGEQVMSKYCVITFQCLSVYLPRGLSFAYLYVQRRFTSVISTYLRHCLSNSTGPIPCALRGS